MNRLLLQRRQNPLLAGTLPGPRRNLPEGTLRRGWLQFPGVQFSGFGTYGLFQRSRSLFRLWS